MVSLCSALGWTIPLATQADGQETATRGVLSGVVVDPSGAMVRGADAELETAQKPRDKGKQHGSSDDLGRFRFEAPVGEYLLKVQAPGFAEFVSQPLHISAGASGLVTVHLRIAHLDQEVSVPGDQGASGRTTSALTFEGKQLELFSSDDATFRQQLMALAGVGGAPSILVNGFSGGRIPPKSTIQSIRINQNPFSSYFAEFGAGRLEITTEPGGEKLHGTMQFSGTDQALDARNPYTEIKPAFYDFQHDGTLSGRLPGKLPFFLSDSVERLANSAVVNAADPANPSAQISTAEPAPELTQVYSLRIDRQFTAQNQAYVREEWSDTKRTNDGIVPLVLPTAAFASEKLTNSLQLVDTQVFGGHAVNEMRAQYLRTRVRQQPNSTLPSVIVQGVLQSGGSPAQRLEDRQDQYEIQDQFETEWHAHAIRAGAHVRVLRDSNVSSAGFNGQYIFPDTVSYLAGQASQYSQTFGQQGAVLLSEDLALYADDDWKVTQHLNLNFGMRFESQTAIPDHSDPAPRVAFAWDLQPGKRKTPVLSVLGGYGIFYDRFPVAQLLQSVRQNGTRQVAYFAQNTAFNPDGPPPGVDLSAGEPTIYQVNPKLHSRLAQVGNVTVRRSLWGRGVISADLLFAHDEHVYLTRNLNAPLPGTVTPGNPASGLRPFGAENLYSFSSDANGNLERFAINFRVQPVSKVFLFGVFAAEKNYTESDSIDSFPSNEYNVRQDYGRASLNRRQWFTGGFQWTLPYGFTLSPYLDAHSGAPFNITTGQDLNGDTIYNDRPAFAGTGSGAAVVQTAFGNFNVVPGQNVPAIPRNFATAPPYFWLQLNAAKEIHLGPRPEAAASPGATPERPWTLRFAVEAHNLTNHNNPGLPIGVLSPQPCSTASGAPCGLVPSGYFGHSLSLANDFSPVTASNRSLLLQTSFSW